MSKERELLESCLDEMQYHSLVCPELKFEIQELLAQPAPITFKDDADKIAHLENSVELLSSLLDASKREPLSDAEIAKLWGESYTGTTQMVRNFARAIEKAHGITGGGE